MGDKNSFRSDLLTRNSGLGLGFGNEIFHDLADVLNIETSGMEGAVAGHGGEDFADGLNSAVARCLRTFNDESSGSHSNNHAVSTAVERNGRVCYGFIGGCCAAGEEAGTHPLDEVVGADVVGRDNHYALAAPGVDPVVC